MSLAAVAHLRHSGTPIRIRIPFFFFDSYQFPLAAQGASHVDEESIDSVRREHIAMHLRRLR